MQNCCDDLPQDVLIEILSRLPVKSLLRFKCVCKYFRFLIQSPSFIQKHLESTTLDDSLFLVHRDGYTNEDVISLFTAQKLDQGPEKLRIPLKKQCFVHITGPCHGFFCLYDYFEDLFLWNPATTEIKDLPKPGHIFLPPESKLSSVNFGFGFDPTRNDYKVIRLEQLNNPEHEPHHVEIYNLSTNSWRKIDAGFSADIWNKLNSTATYANGVYYWWGSNWSTDHRHIVIPFDMVDEVFQMTPLPDFWYHYFFQMFFTLWNESLAVILPCERDNSDRFAIWRMNGYGNYEANWTKLLSFTIEGRIDRPMGIWNKKSHELVLYNAYGRVVSFI